MHKEIRFTPTSENVFVGIEVWEEMLLAAQMQATSPERNFWFLFPPTFRREQRLNGKYLSIAEFPKDF